MVTIVSSEVSLNGRLVLLPDEAVWTRLQKDPHLNGLPVHSENSKGIFDWTLDFVSRHKTDFRCGFYKAGQAVKFWTLLVLLKTPAGHQEVQLENLVCDNCHWSGVAANPTLPDLYFGGSECRAAVARAWMLKQSPCPICGAKLPRPAIWVEPPI